jgi:Na+/H+ antiporter NhaB
VILAEYFEIWIIELTLNGYCLNCSESDKVQDQVGQIYTVINIIKIKELASHFARCGLTDRSVTIQILTLFMWQNFNTKRGTQQKKTVGMETLNTHFLLTVYILYKRTKFPSIIVFTSQSHKIAYFYDVGSTYAIDQKINHLHNNRVANMWRNNVPSVCGRG